MQQLHMLYEAIFVADNNKKPPKDIINKPELSKYTKDWYRNIYDIAIVAEYDNQLIGAVWGRTFNNENKGYGFVDDKTPEISMAVIENYRNKGIGSQLLEAIINKYRNLNIKALSLSVDRLNSAMKLYEKFGFVTVSEDENPIMLLKLNNSSNF